MSIADRDRVALEALEYTEEWLSSGILSPDTLAEQAERLSSGGTQKTGRYRAQTVTAWCQAEGAAPDDQVDGLLSLLASESDEKVARAGVTELIGSARISLDQLGRIASSDPKLMRRHEALIRRTYLGRRLDDEVSDELVAQVVELGDASLQTRLVRDPRLSRKHAEALARRGANPTIRSNAEAWAQDKKAWR